MLNHKNQAGETMMTTTLAFKCTRAEYSRDTGETASQGKQKHLGSKSDTKHEKAFQK